MTTTEHPKNGVGVRTKVDHAPRPPLAARLRYPVLVVLAIVFIAVLPGAVPNRYVLFTIATGAVYLIAVLGLNLTLSSGAVSMGTSAFMLIGAYAVALSQVKGGYPAIVGIGIGIVACAVIGVVTAIPALRLGAFAVAVVTLMYGDVVAALALRFSSFTGGGEGVPSVAADLPLSVKWFIIAGCALVAFLFHRNLIQGPMGRALMITRRGEEVATSLAISPGRYKIGAFTTYAVMAGIAGGLYQQLNGPIGVDTFGISLSITLLLMVVLGGTATVSGPVLGVVVLTIVPLVQSQSSGGGTSYRDLIYGIVLLAVVLIVPKGLAGVRVSESWTRRLPTVGRRTTPAGETSTPADLTALAELLSQGRGAASGELVIEGVRRSIGGLHILRGITMRVDPGTICGLIGPNGSGKTTLLNSISGLSPIEAGSMTLGGVALGKAARSRASDGIGRSFQTVIVAEQKSVRENLMVGLDTQRTSGHLAYALRLPSACREARQHDHLITTWAGALGLGAQLEADASTLTPRERRLLELGRALLTQPRLLLLDEPVAGLTGEEIEELVGIIRAVKASGTAIILVEHHAELVMSLCDTVTVLDAGEVIASGEPAVVSADPKVIAAYLGDELAEMGDELVETTTERETDIP